jgi:acetyl esterase/lipase
MKHIWIVLRTLTAVALLAGSVAPAPAQAGKSPVVLAVPEGVAAHRELAYVDNGHARQVLDLYVPEKATGPLPVIVWIHGGAWSGGDKNGCPPLRQGYAQRGYAVASLNYRLSQHATFPAQIEDCKAALRWLRAHAKQYHLDPAKIGVWGSSAGGHLVALLGVTGDVKEFDVGQHLELSSAVQCVMDDYGPTDFGQMDANRPPGATMSHSVPNSPESRLIGGLITLPENRAKVQRANPISYVSKGDAPFLINHGDIDPTVPHHQSELLFAALQAAGVPVRFNTVKGGGHGAGFGGAELDKLRRDFLELHLKGVKNDAAQWPAAMRSSTDAIASGVAPAKKGGAGKKQ